MKYLAILVLFLNACAIPPRKPEPYELQQRKPDFTNEYTADFPETWGSEEWRASQRELSARVSNCNMDKQRKGEC